MKMANIIISGGFDLSSVEIFNPSERSWHSGPELPTKVDGGAMVEDPLGKITIF